MSARSFAPSWAETFHDLQSASTVEELWGVLLDWHGIRSSSMWHEPHMLFMRFHRHDSTDAEVTAVLLCTDHRWRNAATHLIDRLCGSDVLDDGQLDALADWLSGQVFEVAIDNSDTLQPGRDAMVQRPIWPPLRRWAARHQVERRPDRWFALIDASTTLRSRDAAATVAGVLDAADRIPAEDRPTLAEFGLSHGSGTVRLAALPLLASIAGTDVAIDTAQRDPAGKVRAWNPYVASRGDPIDDHAPASSASGTSRPTFGQASLLE